MYAFEVGPLIAIVLASHPVNLQFKTSGAPLSGAHEIGYVQEAVPNFPEQLWVVTASRPTLEEAKEEALKYASVSSGTRVIRTKNNWFAVVTDRVHENYVDEQLQKLKDEGTVSADAFATRGRNFIEVVYTITSEEEEKAFTNHKAFFKQMFHGSHNFIYKNECTLSWSDSLDNEIEFNLKALRTDETILGRWNERLAVQFESLNSSTMERPILYLSEAGIRVANRLGQKNFVKALNFQISGMIGYCILK